MVWCLTPTNRSVCKIRSFISAWCYRVERYKCHNKKYFYNLEVTNYLFIGGEGGHERVSGSLYSAKVKTVLKSVRSMPEHLRSMHVTLCPEPSRRVRILYQHQAPWPAPWTSTKCSCFEPERPLSLAIFFLD